MKICYGCSNAIYNLKKNKTLQSLMVWKRKYVGFVWLSHSVRKASVSGLYFIFLVIEYDLGLKGGNVATVFITEHDQN